MLTENIISSLRDFLSIYNMYSTNILSLTGQDQSDRNMFSARMQFVKANNLIGQSLTGQEQSERNIYPARMQFVRANNLTGKSLTGPKQSDRNMHSVRTQFVKANNLTGQSRRDWILVE
jgi:hypothetical protein